MVRSIIVFLLFAALLVGCGGTSPGITAQGVLDQFKAAGLEVSNPEVPARESDSPLPNSYKDRMWFDVVRLGTNDKGEGRGGQVFVCDTKQNCDAIFAYFDALKALAGPYIYRSAGGTVVVQMNKGLAPDEAAKYGQIVEALP